MNNLSSCCGLVIDAKIRASDKDLPVMQKPCQSKSVHQTSSLSKELAKNLKLIAANDAVLQDSAQQVGQKTSQNVIPVFFKFQDIKFTKFMSLADLKVELEIENAKALESVELGTSSGFVPGTN